LRYLKYARGFVPGCFIMMSQNWDSRYCHLVKYLIILVPKMLSFDSILNISFHYWLAYWPNRLECFFTLERLAKEKHSSLLGPFKSYEENPNEERNKALENFSFFVKGGSANNSCRIYFNII
jgi:hypothetical protein